MRSRQWRFGSWERNVCISYSARPFRRRVHISPSLPSRKFPTNRRGQRRQECGKYVNSWYPLPRTTKRQPRGNREATGAATGAATGGGVTVTMLRTMIRMGASSTSCRGLSTLPSRPPRWKHGQRTGGPAASHAGLEVPAHARYGCLKCTKCSCFWSAMATRARNDSGSEMTAPGPSTSRDSPKPGPSCASGPVCPVRIISSPFQRCLQSITPLADALGTSVRTSPSLIPDAGAAATNLALNVSFNGRALLVLCTHGEVIHDMQSRLGLDGASNFNVGAPREKASVWILERSDRRFVSATYLAPPVLQPSDLQP